ncbi:hypothetical protein BJ741DRAFT_667896 [Chytriomyces cf. hyalinus JEL632]|nr:hypothetical protein BJ741DRAFT_667896 [Chytriomyces cf. hyalinus JEL632]
MLQHNSAEIKDHLQAPLKGPEFPHLLTDICALLKERRGVVANGVGLSDLTHSPSSYGVSYFAAEKMGGYFVSTLNGDKAVPATFLFPAMVLNSSDLTFAPPRPDSSFSVAGLYCQVLCDEWTSTGFQTWLESGTVLKDRQTIKGKRFEFGNGLIPSGTDKLLFTRFSRTCVTPAQSPSTPTCGPRSQFSTPSRTQNQNVPGSPYRSFGAKTEPPRPFTIDPKTAKPFIPLHDCRTDAYDLRDLSKNSQIGPKVCPGDLVLISACVQIHKSSGCVEVEVSFPPNFVVLFERGTGTDDMLDFPSKPVLTVKGNDW